MDASSSGDSDLNGTYHYQNDSFELEMKIIAKSSGLFYMRFGGGVENSNQSFPGKCRHTSFDARMDFNAGLDGHIDLMKASPNPHFNTWYLEKPDDRFYRRGGYCFRVE